MDPRTRRLHRALGAAALLVCLATAGAAERQVVLCVHSYHKADWTDELLRGYHAGLGERPTLDLAVEYMDAKRQQGADYLAQWWALFRRKHGTPRFAVVIASDDIAYRSCLERQDAELGGAPLVFCGVNRWDPSEIAGRDRVTGVVERGDFAANLDLVFRLRPQAGTLWVVCDRSETGLGNLAELERALAGRPGLRLGLLQDLELAGLADRLRGLPPQDAAFFLAFWKDRGGRDISPGELGEAFRASAAPVFGRSEWMVGRGLVGGLCVTGFGQGRTAGRMAGSILDGVAARDLPVVGDSPNQWLFDHDQLDRHALDGVALPAGSELRNLPDDAWHRNRAALITVAAIIAALTALSASLLVAMSRTRRAEIRLRAREAETNAIFDQTFQFMGLCDLDGRLTAVNRAALEFAGVAAGQVLGLPFPDGPWWTHDPEQQRRLRDAFAEAAHGRTVRLSTTHRRCDGSLRHVDFSLKPVRGGDDACVGYIAEGRDVTEQQIAVNAQAESEERFRQLAQHLDQVFWLMEWPSMRLLYRSPAFARVYGRDPLAVSADAGSWQDLIHPEDRERVAASFTAQAPTGWRAEYRVLRPDGEVRWIDDRAFPVCDPQGRAFRIAGLAEDITERRAVEERMRAAQRMEAMGQLAGGVAHDFNNQLTAILGYADLLGSAVQDERERGWAKAISTAAQRSASLTRQLLAFSRQGGASMGPVDLNQVAREALALVQVGLSPGVRIEDRIGGSPLIVQGDPGLLQNAVLNLCLNARDAMPDGGTMRIGTGIERIDEEPHDPRLAELPLGAYARLEVSDSGIGMTADVQARLFEPFFTTKPVGRGTGLGLAAVYGTIHRHHGAVEVASQPGHGSRFALWLPLAADAGPARPSTGPRPSLGGTILVADDEPALRSLVAEHLSQLGYAAITAADADQAVQCWKEKRPQLAILDVQMPGGGAAAAFAAIRAIDPSAAILLMTGYAQDAEVQRLVDAGAAGPLAKPFSARSLGQMVAELIGASRALAP